MNKYNSEWINEMVLKYPDIPVIEIDYKELKNMDIKIIPGEDFTPGLKKEEPQYRDSPFADSYFPRRKS
jgi:alanine-alpha-ketoisovalerate/valine-pyruvate aminotransferase